MSDNAYQEPDTNVTNPTGDTSLKEGTLEKAIRGEYEVDVTRLRKESWRLVKGNKGIFWLAFIIGTSVSGGLSLLLPEFDHEPLKEINAEAVILNMVSGYMRGALSGYLILPITAPLGAGLLMLMVKRVAGDKVGVSELFAYFNLLLSLVVLAVAQSVLAHIGFLLLLIPGVYLQVAYSFATPLLIDKKLTPWQSLEASRKAVSHHWFQVCWFHFLMGLIVVASCLTLIGPIWTLPMWFIGYALLYRNIFGLERLE